MKHTYLMTRRALSLALLLTSTPLASFAQTLPASTIAPVTTLPTSPTSTPTAPTRVVDPAQTAALLKAMKSKNWDAMSAALQAGADINAADKDGATVLMRASDAQKPEVVSALLRAGADPNAQDRKGHTALYYALPEGKKKKKKFGLGSVAKIAGGVLTGGMMGGLMNNMLGSALLGGMQLDSLLGNNLNSLLSAGTFDLSGKNNWMAIAGTALQGDPDGKRGVAPVLSSTTKDKTKALDAEGWTTLLSSVQNTKPEILSAMGQLSPQSNPQSSALWNQFLLAASSGDQEQTETLMKNPALKPLLSQAQSGLSQAEKELPGNISRDIITQLLEAGANPQLGGDDAPAKVAQERELTELANLISGQQG